MWPYLVLVTVVFTLGLLGDLVFREFATRRDSEWRASTARTLGFFEILIVGALVGFSGLRYMVGTDYPNYLRHYLSLDAGDWASEIAEVPQDLGYTLLALLTKTLFDSPYAIFWVSSLVTVAPIIFVLIKRSAVPALSIALYVLIAFAVALNGVRQGIAAALLFLAWHYLDRRRIVFFVLAAVASSLHVSALFAAVIIYFFNRSRLTARVVVVSLSSAVVGAIMVDRVPFVSEWIGLFNPRYGAYFQSGETGLGAYLQIFAYLVILIMCAWASGREGLLRDENQRLLVFVLVGLVFMVIGTQAVIVFRMSSYFTLFLFLLVPGLLAPSSAMGRVPDASSKRAVAILAVIATGLVYYCFHVSIYGDMIPYRTYLQSW